MILLDQISSMIAAWFGFTAIIFSILFVIIFWAVKNKQFTNQSHANHLPLQSYIPEEESEKEKQNA